MPAFSRAGGPEAERARPFAALAAVATGAVALLLAPAVAVLGGLGQTLAR